MGKIKERIKNALGCVYVLLLAKTAIQEMFLNKHLKIILQTHIQWKV